MMLMLIFHEHHHSMVQINCTTHHHHRHHHQHHHDHREMLCGHDQAEFARVLKDYVGRETPLYPAERLSEHYRQ